MKTCLRKPKKFYIITITRNSSSTLLQGKAVFEVDDVILIVHEEEGITIEPRQKHRIMNKEEGSLEFIVCSQPSTQNDRHNIV